MQKIIFVLAVALLCCGQNVKAQNGYDDTKHEVAVSYGLYSNSQIIDLYSVYSIFFFDFQ